MQYPFQCTVLLRIKSESLPNGVPSLRTIMYSGIGHVYQHVYFRSAIV